jgi:hypothetical protein
MKRILVILFFIQSCALMAQVPELLVSDSISEIKTEDNFVFCPDSLAAENLKILENCCCMRDDNCAASAGPLGYKIIETGYQMTIVKKQIIKGSCWQFADEVYKQAGFPQDKRITVFKSTKAGPYVDSKSLQPGDWIYHVNCSFHNVDHSAIFICWKDFDKKIAITLGHLGQNLARTGIYGEFDLKSVYYITRPKE